MIDISGHLRPIKSDMGFEDLSSDIVVNCCGYQSFKKMDFSRKRPHGRLDYQIIYIYKGAGEYFLNNKFIKKNAGNIIIYPPGVPQIYTYYAADKPEIYWIHFTGIRAKEFMAQFGLGKTEAMYIGTNNSLTALFNNIIYELQLKRKNYTHITHSHLINILAIINRTLEEKTTGDVQKNRILRTIQYIHSNYSNKITVDTLAQMANLSKYRFLHVFKESMGLAPIEYLTTVRIDKAKELLIDSSLSVKQISDFIGYASPLYFSRIFAKHVGVPPSIYSGKKK